MQPVSASIVMYNGASEVLSCIQSLQKVAGANPPQLFVVDNASPDGSFETLARQNLPNFVTLLPQDWNRGFGAGHNVVLPMLKSRYHAVVNPDIVFTEDVFATMSAYMDAHPDVAVTIPRLQFPDGRPQYVAKRRPALLPLLSRQLPLPFLKKYERHYLMLDEDLTHPLDVEFCSGSFFLMRTDVFKQIGGFDEGYFMYVEDADITRKALLHGRAVYLPDAVVTHAWHRDAHRRPRQFFWQVKSMLRYFNKWGFRLK